MLTVPDSSY